MIPGAAAILAGAGAFTFFNRNDIDPTIENFLDNTRQLSPSGKASLDEVCSHKNPFDGAVSLSFGDIMAIFWNSRLYLCIANSARLCEPNDKDLLDIFHIIHREHARLRWLVFMAIIERIVGRFGLGRVTMYHRMLLWTYGGELELLDQISQKCGVEGTAIQAIL